MAEDDTVKIVVSCELADYLEAKTGSVEREEGGYASRWTGDAKDRS